MKVSVSLPDDDIDFLDARVRGQEFESRSAAVHAAIRLMRAVALTSAYAEAADEWQATEEGVWESSIRDGLDG